MTDDAIYHKSFLCECGCAWSDVDQGNNDICWSCGSSGPHKSIAMSRRDPKILFIERYDMDPFALIGEIGE